MSIFPSMAASVASGAPAAPLPVAKEVMWDFTENLPVFRAGNPLYVYGADAVLVWAWKAVQARRYVHEIYSYNYGFDGWKLIGQAYSEQLKTAEATRYLRECLLINRYITDVRDLAVSFDGDEISLDCTLVTIYGEVKLHV